MVSAQPAQEPARCTTRQARAWLGLALVTLLLGGGLSLVLIASRVPGMTHFLDAPLLAKKSLVIHVNLVLTCWFCAFIAALFSLIPGERQLFWPVGVSALGVVLFVVSGVLPGAEPILSNYVPVLDQPAFLLGVGLFVLGVVLALVDGERLLGTRQRSRAAQQPFLSDAAVTGLRAAAWLVALALVVMASAIVYTPRGLDAHPFYEAVFWGAGHVFQFVFLAAMLSVWLTLVRDATGRCPLADQNAAWLVFALVIAPALPALWLLGRAPADAGFYAVPTEMMRWGTWAAPALTLAYSLAALRRAFWERRLRFSSSLSAWMVSVALLGLGVALGVMIERSSTLVPAHYHATVGAVTVALMGVSFQIFAALGRPLPSERLRRWATWQPIVFGVGQLGFVLGFAWAGWHGLGRKVYGSEQTVRGLEQTLGLAVMGVGGTLALVGGLLYFVLVYRCGRARPSALS